MLDEEIKNQKVSEHKTNSIAREVELRLSPIVETINTNLTSEGLLPEIEEKENKKGFNSEMMGYAMRIAVDTNDKELFSRLKAGASLFKQENGLFAARLNKDKTPDNSEGSTWADANQDIALAFIEAGQKWQDPNLVQEGRNIAEAFLAFQVVESGELTFPLQNTSEEESRGLGNRVRRVNLSMFNPKLYETMQRLSPTDQRWTKLAESATELVGQALEKFALPPDRVCIVEGRMFSDIELKNMLAENPTETFGIPDATIKQISEYSDDQLRPRWGFDSMRIPFRLNDSQEMADRKMADTIHSRLQKFGGIKTAYFADNGEVGPDSLVAAVATAPLVKSIEAISGSKLDAIREIDRTISPTDKQVLYWQLWRGLGLLQINKK